MFVFTFGFVFAFGSRLSAEVVVSSMYRRGSLVNESLFSVVRCSFLGGVHVHGYNPAHEHSGITGHALAGSPFHNAYRWLRTNYESRVPTLALAGGNKAAFDDSVRRSFWRTSVNLDAWFVLSAAVSRGEADVVVWMENDGIVRDCGVFERALRRFVDSGASGASCYGREGVVYVGSGAVCLLFLRSRLGEILKHVLGYHMVQPFDWIVSDYAQGRWTTYDVVRHGRSGRAHASTLG